MAKPAGVELAVSCNTFYLHWKGEADQQYEASIELRDGAAQTAVRSVQNSPVTSGTGGDYSAVFTVSAGALVRWHIQAVSQIDSRPMYSYPLTSEEEYLVPACPGALSAEARAGALSAAAAEAPGTSRDRFSVYPTLAGDILNLQLVNPYTGAIAVRVQDASGRTVLQSSVSKQKPDLLHRLSVNGIPPGLYFLQVRMQNGRMLTAKFLKK